MHTLASTLRFGCPLAKAEGALILIHGRGASAEDIAGLTDAFDAPEFAFMAPSARDSVWYPQRFFASLKENEPGLTSALLTVESLVKEITMAGISLRRIGIIGFSQGACLALEHTARAGARYGFTAGLSGALIGPLGVPRPKSNLQGMPVLVACAEADAHFPLPYVEASATLLEGMNATLTKQIYPGNAHTVFPQEITWINQHLKELRA